MIKKISTLLLQDSLILAIISINAIIIFLQGFTFSPALQHVFLHIDNIITLVFIWECVAKWKFLSRKSYFSSSWNVLDFILLIFALPSLFFWFAPEQSINLDYLLVMRLARVFKFFRFLRFFPHIEQLINGTKRALKASVVVLLGFFIFIFISAVITTFLFRESSPEFFGNPFISLYAIFKVFTVEGWYEIPETIAQNYSGIGSSFILFFFVMLLLLGGIFGLSLVNSIFVDAMVSDNNDELELRVKELQSHIESLEQKIDRLVEIHTQEKL